MSFQPQNGYELGGSPDIAREDDLLATLNIRVTAPGEGTIPRLDDTDPIDLEGLRIRTVRGFRLADDMTKFV